MGRAARLAIPLLYLLMTLGCDPAEEEIVPFAGPYDESVETAYGIRTLYSDSAKLKVLVDAPKMVNHVGGRNPRQEFPDGLRVTFLDENQDTSSTLDARWGTYDTRQKVITVRDSVVWQSVDRQRLETEELNWNEREERIYTNQFVVLTQPDYIITGYGLEADQQFTDARVLQVDGRIPVTKPVD